MKPHSILAFSLALQLGMSMVDIHALETSSPAELKLKQVALYSSGLGAFLYEAEVEEAAVFRIDLPIREVSDVLRSVVVADPANQLDFVRVAAAEDLSLPADLLPSLESRIDLLLSQRGELLEVKTNSGTELVGRLVALENSLEPSMGQMAERVRLSLLVNERLETILLDEVRSFRPCDAKVQQQIDLALAHSHPRQNTVSVAVEVGFRAAGKRVIELGYLRPIPAWKTAYSLRDNQLQMRVVVDNTTDSDWKDVTLTVAHGQPVSFQIDLHQIVRLQRETMQLPLGLPGLPPIFAESRLPYPPNLSMVVSAPQTNHSQSGFGLGGGSGAGMGGAGMESSRYGSFGRGMGGGYGGAMGGSLGGSWESSDPNAASVDDSNALNPYGGDPFGSDSQDSAYDPFALPNDLALASQPTLQQASDGAGENFSLSFQTVSIPAHTSSLLTSSAIDVDAEPVSFYVEAYNSTTPLFSQRMLNHSEMLLPAGPINFFVGARYQGEAMLPRLSPGRTRIVSFALDTSLRVAPVHGASNQLNRNILFDEPHRRMIITDVNTRIDQFVVSNSSGDARQLEISYPKPSAEWSVKLEEQDEKTDDSYRIRLTVPAKAESTRTIRLESTKQHILTYRKASLNDLRQLQLQTPELEAASAQQLRELMVVRERSDGLQIEMKALQSRLDEKQVDVDRLVKILSTDGLLPATKERYAVRIEEREAERADLVNQLETAQAALRVLDEQFGP